MRPLQWSGGEWLQLGGLQTGRFLGAKAPKRGHCAFAVSTPHSATLSWKIIVAINKRDLFESTKALWPETINLSEPNAANNIYWLLEGAFPAGDNWRHVAMWAFHQALSELETQAVADGVSTISPHSLEYSAFDRWMRFNLEGDDGWATERIAWEEGA